MTGSPIRKVVKKNTEKLNINKISNTNMKKCLI